MAQAGDRAVDDLAVDGLGDLGEAQHRLQLDDRQSHRNGLVDHFVGLYARKYDKPVLAIPPDVARALEDYDWPGNVRALRHAAERAVILAEGDAFRAEDFSLSRAAPMPRASAPAPARHDDLNLERAEKQMVEEALRKHSYNISLAAAELGLTRASLYRRMEKHGL